MGALSNMVGEIRLDASGVDKGVNEAESSMSGLGDTAQSVGSSMQSAGKTMTAGVTAPLAAMGGMAAREAATFESSMQKSIAVMGDVSDTMREDLEATAREVATSTTLSHEEAAESFYFLSSAGLDAAESIEAMPAVANLAESGAMNMADATDYATNIMSAFGKEASDLDGIVDQMAATFSNHNQTAEDVGQGLAKIGPVASSVGMSMEDAAAAIGMLGDVGYSGTEAATALRGGMTRLMNPTGEAEDMLEQLGVQVMDSAGNMRSMGDILRDLEAGGASAQQMMKIFGQEAGPAMQSMLGQGGDALDEYSAAIKDSEGAAQDIAETQRDTLMGSIEILKSNVSDLAISFGAELTPVLRRAAEFASTLSTRFGELSPATRKVVVAVAAVAAAIGPLLFAFGTILTLIPSMTAGFATVAATLGGVGSALVGIPGMLMGIGTAISSTLLGALTSVGTALLGLPGLLYSTAVSFGTTLATGVMSAVSSLLAFPGAVAGAVAAKLTAILQAGILASAYTGLRTAALFAAGGIRTVGMALLTAAAPLAALTVAAIALYAAWKTNFLGIRDITSGVVKGIKALLSGDFQTIKQLIGGVATRARELWTNNIVPILTRAREVFTQLRTQVIQPFLEWFTPIFQTHLSTIASEFVKTANVWISTISRFVEWARPYVNAFLKQLSAWWGQHGSDVMAIVNPLMAFLKRVIRDGLSLVSDIVVGLLRLMRGDFDGFADSLMSIVDTLTKGVVDLFRWLYKTLVGGSIVPDMLDDILSVFRRIGDKIVGAVSDFAGNAVQKFRNFASDALGALTSKVSDFRSAGKSLITAVGDGIRDNVNNIKGKVKGAAQKVRDYWPSSPAKEGPLSDIDKIGPGMMRTIADSIESSSGVAERATASAAEAVEGAFQLGGAQEKYIAAIAENYDWGPGGGSGDDSLGPGADPSVSRRARKLLEESGIHESTLGELSHAEALGEALSRGLMEVPEHFEENQDMLTPDWFGDADERARRLGGISENTGKVMAEDGSYVDPSFWSGAGEKLAEGASNTLQSIVDSAGEFDSGAAREALSTLGTSQRLELSNALENSKWFDKSYEASRQIRDAVENGNLSQQLYDALISDSGVYGELESLVNEGDRQEELVRAEDGSMVPKSFYDNAPPEVTQEVNIDFAGLDDDAWISVGALKEEFAKHQDKREERERNRSVRTY